MVMRTEAPGLYKRISCLVELAFGLLLLLNGFLLLINSSILFSFKEKLLHFLRVEDLANRSAIEWRAFIEFIHAVLITHISVFAMICMGVVIFLAGLHAKRAI